MATYDYTVLRKGEISGLLLGKPSRYNATFMEYADPTVFVPMCLVLGVEGDALAYLDMR